MRIIDKNTDFYDYCQNMYRDNSLTFDRTDSFILSKDDLCGYLYVNKYTKDGDFEYLLLQVGNVFWIFLVTINKIDDNRRVKDCTIELLSSWRNYTKKRCLIQLEVISFGWDIRRKLFTCFIPWYQRLGENEKQKVREKKSILLDAINTNNYQVENKIDKQRVNIGGNEWVEKHIPLLKSCGLASWINPLDIYLAFEEYFSQEKTASERSESVGLTDKERIENHGFDVKISFRGKTKRN
ncbi:MAG: hypothetical protein IJ171_08860 [Ruminococcus sp.]|nr:hypothetical protein [Ruminococcus sp.]